MEQGKEPDSPSGVRPREPQAPPLFVHPPWMVGVVLVLGVLALIAGFSDPIWFVLGGPCILVLVLYLYVRFKKRE